MDLSAIGEMNEKYFVEGIRMGIAEIKLLILHQRMKVLEPKAHEAFDDLLTAIDNYKEEAGSKVLSDYLDLSSKSQPC